MPSPHPRRASYRREPLSPLPDFTDAACQLSDLTPDAWFPDPVTGPDGALPAAAVCSTYPLSRPCFDYARQRGLDGVWGGVFLRGGYRVTRRSPRAASSPAPVPR